MTYCAGQANWLHLVPLWENVIGLLLMREFWGEQLNEEGASGGKVTHSLGFFRAEKLSCCSSAVLLAGKENRAIEHSHPYFVANSQAVVMSSFQVKSSFKNNTVYTSVYVQCKYCRFSCMIWGGQLHVYLSSCRLCKHQYKYLRFYRASPTKLSKCDKKLYEQCGG